MECDKEGEYIVSGSIGIMRHCVGHRVLNREDITLCIPLQFHGNPTVRKEWRIWVHGTNFRNDWEDVN